MQHRQLLRTVIFTMNAQTPNIDRLANEEMLMNNVFCTNAICTPSRAAILTGKYSHVNSYYKNESGGQFNPNQWTFPEELQKKYNDDKSLDEMHAITDANFGNVSNYKGEY